MGRPFAQELEATIETFEVCSNYDYEDFQKYIKNILCDPVIAVGSGGSFAVASAFCLLIESLGGFAKAITPFELRNEKSIYKCHIILFTAGGNNPDTINAYNYIKKCEPRSSYVICTRQNSNIENEMLKYNDKNIKSIFIPNGKDGFLAVNSTIGMLAAFVKIYSNILEIENDKIDLNNRINIDLEIINKKTIIALCGQWTLPVIIDFESKCTEAGLVNVQIANLRNFAHGRHHWIAKNIEDTGIICFITEEDSKLATRTLKYIPDIPKVIFESNNNNINALPELFLEMFRIVHQFGKHRNIDPGRPQVPSFGSKIYHINYDLSKNDMDLKEREKSLFKKALYRKNPIYLEPRYKRFMDIYNKGFSYFKRNLFNNVFNSIIFDFDNTIILKNDTNAENYLKIVEKISEMLNNGIEVGFATGRGISIYHTLRDIIPKSLWEKVWIGYYNGSFIKNLNEDLIKIPENKEIKDLYDFLCEFGIESSCIEYRNSQISIFIDSSSREWLLKFIREIVEIKKYCLRIYETDHSIDIVINSVSKKCLYDYFKEKNYSILSIGDSGDLNGNDFELLNNDFSLSVDKVSYSYKNCWFLAPLGFKGPAATLYYLEHVNFANDIIGFKLEIFR